MSTPNTGGQINYNEDEFSDLVAGPNGAVAILLQKAGEQITQEAKRLAPTSPHGSGGRPSGYLRSHIGWELDTSDPSNLGVTVSSSATTVDGKPYGLFQEVGWTKSNGQPGKHTPHLRPAVETVRARGIQS